METNSNSCAQMVQSILKEKYHEVRTSIPARNPPDQGEEHHDVFHGEADGSHPAERQQADDLEARDDLWSIPGNFIYRHHVRTLSSALCAARTLITYTTQIY